MTTQNDIETVDTVVIGGGQAGLAVGYYLAKQGRSFVILDANKRTGDSWRNRWDSLLLFTPARFNALPGMRQPFSGGTFIAKDQMADYLEAYAEKFALPVRHGQTVERLSRQGNRYVVAAGGSQICANNVVVAMANYQVPSVPSYAGDLGSDIKQLTAKEYRNPAQLHDGDVLLVGVGNSGADIAMDVVKSHATWLAGEPGSVVPFRIEPFISRNVLIRIVRFMGHRVLTVRTPLGRKLRPKLLTSPAPLIRVKPKDLVNAGVNRVPRVVGVQDGRPLLDDGRVLDVANVIWCTGFRPGFSWIDLPILGDHHDPVHERGVVTGEPGLYFVGLHFLYSMTSDTITGVTRDAKRIARELGKRAASPSSRTSARPAAASPPVADVARAPSQSSRLPAPPSNRPAATSSRPGVGSGTG
jgi:putative flavoprotein involved in K+ transport